MHLGLGTAAIGRPHYINIRSEEAPAFELAHFKREGIQMLQAAYDAGVRYFDTAPGYGIAEELMIEWLRTNPEGVEVATKWGYEYVANFDPKAEIHEVKDHSLQMLLKQWKQSQSVFPQLSTLQIHSATLETRVLENQEVLHQLLALKREFGLKIGLTTTGENQYEVFQRSFDVTFDQEPLFEVYQCTYNMLDQSMRPAAELCQKEGRRFIVKEALANGRVFKNPQYKLYEGLYGSLESLASKHGVGTDAIALAYCMQSIRPYAVLSGASLIIQLDQNIKSLSVQLSEEDILALDQHGIAPADYWAERKRLGWN